MGEACRTPCRGQHEEVTHAQRGKQSSSRRQRKCHENYHSFTVGNTLRKTTGRRLAGGAQCTTPLPVICSFAMCACLPAMLKGIGPADSTVPLAYSASAYSKPVRSETLA